MIHEIKEILNKCKTNGKDFVVGKRNKIRLVTIDNFNYNVKIFKTPNFIISILYRFFRQSKAKRSFDYAKILESKGIGTPKPIGYYENKNLIQLLDSYYICEHIEADYVFKDLFSLPLEIVEPILKQFADFCFKMHENGIEFLDHSPGNTLIKKIDENKFQFYLIDLNRMKFHSKKMDLNLRMKNICRITPGSSFVEIISKEYAKISNNSETETYNLLHKHSTAFFKKFDNKKKFKKILKIK